MSELLTCLNCRHFHSKKGQCRFRAPSMRRAFNEIQDQITGAAGFWPLVQADDWCGQWQKRRAEPGCEPNPEAGKKPKAPKPEVAGHIKVITQPT